MSDKEKKSGGGAATGSVAVEQTPGNRHKQPYRPTELQDEADLHHKRSKVPAAPTLAEGLKESTIPNDTMEQHECDSAMSSEKYKHNKTKIISSSGKRRDSSPETITLAPLEVETKKGTLSVPPQPIPAQVQSVVSATSNLIAEKIHEIDINKKADDDSITEEIAELRTAEEADKHSGWSDEEEAGGLPRSDSRTSRVSRAMRQLFCCGVLYEAPSEDNISSEQTYATGI